MQLLNGRLTLSPSDLNDHVECEHLTTLKRAGGCGGPPRPPAPDDVADLLRRKGEQHEAAYLAELRNAGRQVIDVRAADPWDFDTAARSTENAMRAGADVVYQATFAGGGWRGRADFLERVERPTAVGSWDYEPTDTKLARVEKPTYVLQLCFYSDGIARLQGEAPERMHVLLGIGERRMLRHDDFAAYYRRVRASFEAAVTERRATEPYPVEHCGLCDFRRVCDDWRSQQDHLSLVASIRRDQTLRLAGAGLTTLTRLATAAPDASVDLAPHTFETLREQGELQRIRRTTCRLESRLIPARARPRLRAAAARVGGRRRLRHRGQPVLGAGARPALPARTGDGRGARGRARGVRDGPQGRAAAPWRYLAFWAHHRAEERRAFEALIDFFTERVARHRDMHVYHYGAYEPTAIKQLMSVYATREEAVDALPRRETFVNLHTVVRQALRAGVPS
jgi:predicted RecB family nuclease